MNEPYLLQVVGSAREMGFQHGAAAKKAGTLEAVMFFGTFLDRLFEFATQDSWNRRFRKCLRAGMHRWVDEVLIRSIPKFYNEMIVGFSEGSGLPTSLLRNAYVMPDAYTYLLARHHQFFGRTRLQSIPLGCTAFVLRDPSSFFHARNLDFPGGSRWFNAPAVIEYVPADGMRYASITSLGIDTAGVTSMNEAGIGLSLNLNYSHRVRRKAMPIVALGHHVISRARTLEDGIKILFQHSTTSGWSFLLSSGDEKSAAVIELDGKRRSVRRMDGEFLVTTNHYHSSDLRAQEYWITPERARDTHARFARAETLLRERRISASQALSKAILGDVIDPISNQPRSHGSTICQVHSVCSVIMDPVRRKIHLALGPAPVPRSPYCEIQLFPGPTLAEQSEPERMMERSADDIARETYAKAFEAYFPEEQLKMVGDHLEHCISLKPEEARYQMMLGLLRMKEHQFHEAKQYFTRSLDLAETEDRKDHTKLFLARVLDLLGERNKAIGLYKTLVSRPTYRERANKNLRRPYRPKDLQRFVLEFTLGEAIEMD